jgi:hypothetical protein
LNISNYRNSFDAAYPSINNNFTAFTSDEAIDQLMKIGIPYLSPFGNYQTDSRVETYLYKKIGNVVTNAPLLLFVNEGSYKNAVLAGEGLWRHRIESFKSTSSHTAFDSWIGKIIQYLSIAEDKNRFKLKYPKLISEDEDMIIIGEFYNQSFELTNEPEAMLSLKNDSGQVFKYTFNRVKDYYLANVGKLSTGEYIITAELENAGEKFNRTGKFSVKSSNLESGNIVANFNLLRQISSTSNGEFITAKELNELPQILENLETTQTIIFNKMEYSDLINFKLLFFLFLLLFALEWGIRKYSGTI